MRCRRKAVFDLSVSAGTKLSAYRFTQVIGEGPPGLWLFLDSLMGHNCPSRSPSLSGTLTPLWVSNWEAGCRKPLNSLLSGPPPTISLPSLQLEKGEIASLSLLCLNFLSVPQLRSVLLVLKVMGNMGISRWSSG